MAECFQAANSIGLVIGREQMQFAAGAFHQTWLARNGELFFIRRADNAYLLELKMTHLDEMFRAEPMQTA